MCVIPVYYINAPGQNENEYSHMHALARARTQDTAYPFKVNKYRYGGITISKQTVYSALQMMQPLSRARMIQATHL